MLNIVYAPTREEFGEGPGCYLLMDRATAELSAAAFRCKTWGEYAQLHGFSWSEAVWQWEISEWTLDKNGFDPVSAPDAFDYGKLFFGDWSPTFEDPRQAAYDVIIPYLKSLTDDTFSGALEVSHITLGGNVAAVTATSRDAVHTLYSFLRDAVPGGGPVRRRRRSIVCGIRLNMS